MSDEPERIRLLSQAASVIAGDRDRQYGTPEDSFDAIARHWNAYMRGRTSDFVAGDVAVMMILVKVARMETGGLSQPDTWLDLAGYAGCGFEVSGLKIDE